jgi:hypothetical protein
LFIYFHGKILQEAPADFIRFYVPLIVSLAMMTISVLALQFMITAGAIRLVLSITTGILVYTEALYSFSKIYNISAFSLITQLIDPKSDPKNSQC